MISLTLPEYASKHALLAAAQFFTNLAACESVSSTPFDRVMERQEADRVIGQQDMNHNHMGAVCSGPTIAPDDNPEAGAPPASVIPFPPAVPPAPTITDAAAAFGLAAATAGAEVPAVPLPPSGPTSAVPSVEQPPVPIDSRGIRHDPRIHAKNLSTKKDGSWKSAQGVDAATIAALEAEQRAGAAASAIPLPPTPPVPPVPPVPPAPAAVPPAPPTANASPIPPAPTTATAAAPGNFSDLMMRLGPYLARNVVTPAHLDLCSKAVGVNSVGQLVATENREKVLPFWNHLLTLVALS